MTMFRVSLLVVCLAAASLFAQTSVEAPSAPAPEIELVPETTSPIRERPLRIFADGAAPRARIATEAFGTNGALNDSSTGITLESFASTPNMFMKLGNSDGIAAFTVTNPAGATLFKVRSDGSVALNYTGTNNSRLFVQHGIDNSNAVFVTHQPDVNANTTQYDKGLAVQTTTNVHSGITNSGYLYGTHSWTYMGGTGILSRLYGSLIDVGFSALGAGGTVEHMYGLYLASTNATGSTVNNGYGLFVGNVLGTNDYGIFQGGIDDTNFFAGNTGIGTATPLQKLHVFSGDPAGTIVQVENSSAASGAHSGFRTVSTVSATNYMAHGNHDSSVTRFGLPLAGWGEIVNFNGNGFVMGTAGNTPVVLGTNNAERLRIHGSGKVSIGTTAATEAKLGVQHLAAITSTGNTSDIGLLAVGANSVPVGVTNTGGVIGGRLDGWNYGPGTVAFATGGYFRAGNYAGTTGSVTHALGLQAEVRAESGTITNGYAIFIQDTQAMNDYGIYQSSVNDTNYFAGNVVIGNAPNQTLEMLTVNGNAQFLGTVSGTNIKAHYQDVAEWVPATTDLTPGTVVILNRERSNEVMASATAYDTTVAGVVSAQPGISLGVEEAGKEQIATTGRVKVRVDARLTPVQVGDLLVTSDTPGTAMRSEPMDIKGRKFHQPGTIIGKALEPLGGGIGEILVLLSMQ